MERNIASRILDVEHCKHTIEIRTLDIMLSEHVIPFRGLDIVFHGYDIEVRGLDVVFRRLLEVPRHIDDHLDAADRIRHREAVLVESPTMAPGNCC